MSATCWMCHPNLRYGCVRPSSLLCDEHRAVESARLQVLKDTYGHLTLDEQHALWTANTQKRRRATRSGDES